MCSQSLCPAHSRSPPGAGGKGRQAVAPARQHWAPGDPTSMPLITTTLGRCMTFPLKAKKDSVYPAGPLQCDNSELASQHYISKYRAVLAVLLASLADGVVCCRSVVSALFEAPQNAELQGGGLEHAHTYRIPRGEQPCAQFSSN